MAHRLQLIAQNISKKQNIIDSSFDYLNSASFLTEQENKVRVSVRKFVDQEITPKILPYVEQAKFPQYLAPLFKKQQIGKYFFEKPYGVGARCSLQGSLIAQFARGDAGVATLLIVQYLLLGYTVELLGSEQQKAKYLPGIINFEKIGGWGLTEDKIGSDAANIATSVEKIQKGVKINGVKRWIGNGNQDLLCVWARNTQSKHVQAYLLQCRNLPGFKSEVIKNKIGLRCVENCHITMKDVIVNESQKLPKAKSFQQGTNKILKHSRVMVCWVAAGICMGVYDNAIKYTTARHQFGRPVAGFQLIQQKLVKIMAATQAVLMMCFRISKLVEQGKAELGMIAMTKAYVTSQGRDICRWGREICGGNGLLHEQYVMRAMTDMEAIYTYEGSYEINTLVAGRDLTGLAAFTK